MTITWAQFIWGFALLMAWTGLLLGAIKYLLNRQIATFEAKLKEADEKASRALSGLSEQEKALSDNVSTLRIEIERKTVCSQHARMEENDTSLFKRLDHLHGDIRELVGGVKGLANSLDLVNQHLLNGGR